MAECWPGSSYLLWTNSSSDGNVLRMLSCPLWKWDSRPPYHHPQTLEAPLDHYWNKDHCAARGPEPTGCLEVKRLPESAASRMIDRRLEEVSLLRTLTPRGGNFLSRRSIQTGCRGFEEDVLLNQINGGRRKKSREIDEAEIGKNE